MPQEDLISFTALPNGIDAGGQLRLSVVLTPSIRTPTPPQQPAPAPPTPPPSGVLSQSAFYHWPQRLGATPLTWNVVLTRVDNDGNVKGQPTLVPATAVSSIADLRPDLWKAIFGDDRPAKRRPGTLQKWNISPPVNELHDLQNNLRVTHAMATISQIASDNATLALAKPAPADAVPVLYIFPANKDNPDRSILVANELKFRPAALELQGTAASAIGAVPTTGTPASQAFTKRVQHARMTLEPDDKTWLTPMALYAVNRHCLESLASKGVDLSGDTDPTESALDKCLREQWRSVTEQAIKFTGEPEPSVGAPPDSPQLDTQQNYVEFVLFHRRRRMNDKTAAKLPAPDFHELQGLLHTYPALLRPLGLAFDLTCTVSLKAGHYQVWAIPTQALTVPLMPPNTGPFAQILTTANVTVCSLDSTNGTFCAVERPDSTMISGRYLNLGDADEFALIQEDADGASLKFLDQATNLARSGEFATPTVTPPPAGFVPTPAPSADSGTALPAPRTLGVSLLHTARIDHTQNAVDRPEGEYGSGADARVILYAEDVMLGFRVDVKRNSKGPWKSLCKRTAMYQVTPLGQDQSDSDPKWAPKEGQDDEGFVSFSATHTSDTGSRDADQTKLHPSLFTWTGWSLSVQAPKFDPVNPVDSDTTKPSDRPIQIAPILTLADESQVPLRFEDKIDVRCRTVDLAGNSEPVTATAGPSASLAPFSRHEPYRAPIVVLTEPLDRQRSPGEHVDRLVAHDGHPPRERMLVPPRESLRIAELSKVLDKLKGKLPETAFGNCLLLEDGTFPSVTAARAKERGWLPPLDGKEKIQTADEQDAIFLFAEGGKTPLKVITPYLPDPSAHYIRVDAFLISDDPTVASPVELHSRTHYVQIDIRDWWPDFLATKVILDPISDDKLSVRLDNDARPPIIRVQLPPGRTVVLQISSASHNGTDANWVAPTDVALFHTTAKFFSDLKADLSSLGTEIGNSLQLAQKMNSGQLLSRIFGEVPKPGSQPTEATPEAANVAPTPGIAAAATIALSSLLDTSVFGSGRVPQVSPRRTITFVHALKQPIPLRDEDRVVDVPTATGEDKDATKCDPPKSVKEDSGPIFAALELKRKRGDSRAVIAATLKAHWLTTGKILCQATWTDMIDDITQACPKPISKIDSVLSLTDSDTKRPDTPPAPGDPQVYSRPLQGEHYHLLPDTRARCIQYCLIGATHFREYYPEAKDSNKNALAGKRTLAGPQIEKDFVRYGDVTTVLLKSSVRPPAAVVSYIIPAYAWQDTYDKATHTWRSGRIGVLRIYLERPFRVSGDRESIGLVLAHNIAHTPTTEDSQPLVSRWGADPIKPIHKPIADSALSVGNLCDNADALRLCRLAEGGFAHVKPYPVDFNSHRKLWYADIPVDSLGSLAPFLRLAIVRWQPDALHEDLKDPLPALVSTDPNADCRISIVTTADFIQLNSERWASVHRVDRHTFTVTISGPRPSPSGGAYATSGNVTFSGELQVRWSAAGTDTGWRPETTADGKTGPVDLTPDPAVDDADEMTCWKMTVKIKSTFVARRHRIMLRERESYLDRLDKPVARLVYAKFIDLY
jgi:hypothetical protein